MNEEIELAIRLLSNQAIKEEIIELLPVPEYVPFENDVSSQKCK